MKNLLKKELSELVNKQMLLSLMVSFVVILMLGTLMTTMLTGEVTQSGTVHIIDQDRTAFTRQIMDDLTEQGWRVETGDSFEEMVQTADWTEAVLLPEGMTAALEGHESCELQTYTALQTTSTLLLTMNASNSAERVTAAIRERLSKEYLGGDLAFLQDPVKTTPYTYANGNSVQAQAFSVVSSMTMFDQVMPLVLFLLVVLTAQTIITAIASEKTDKTLEMLLSAPVPRSKIIGAKMLAAVIVALIYVVVYGIAFAASLLLTVSGNSLGETMDVGAAFTDIVKTRQAVQELGLEMSVIGWVGVGAQLVLTLSIALMASIILGALVEDAKNAQSASLPIMLCTMFPYILSMVSDIRNMEGGVHWLMMAIPFTHTFIATGCLRFHDYALFWGGLAYQALFLGGLVWLALRVYSSDLMFVHSRRHRSRKPDAQDA